jgi:hypothetical protein
MAIGRIKEPGKVGVMIVGHREYWPQFPGMNEELLKNAESFKGYIAITGVEVFARFVDTVEDAYSFGVELKTEDIDILFIYLTDAMLAFAHSVQTCNPDSGAFIQYAQAVIRSRLIDNARKELAASMPFIYPGNIQRLSFSSSQRGDNTYKWFHWF